MISTSAILILLAVLFIALFLGVPIGFALGLSGVITILFSADTQYLIQVPITLKNTLSEFIFVAIPLYIIMGNLMYHGKSGERIFAVAHHFLRRVRGGAGVASVAAYTLFAAIVGSSMTSVLTIGRIAIPEMLKQNYTKNLAYGLSALGGSLGILIPPSIPLILYASLSGSSPGHLFMAGIIPGLMIAILLSIYTVIKAPSLKLSMQEIEENTIPEKENKNILFKAIPDLLLPVFILGGIYAGIFTPTEAAAVGVIYAFIVSSIIHRTLPTRLIPTVFIESVKTSAMLLTVVVGAVVFGSALTLLGMPQYLSNFISELSVAPWIVILIMSIIWLIMGFFLEVVSILLITTPIFFPIAMSLGFDPIWFGIIMVINMELAVITPPVGMNLFAIKTLVPKESMGTIIKSVLPFGLIIILVLALVWIFPEIALFILG
ncbi:TRAP transporter large permease [Psychrobacillus lasiicapitis]|uniref:TRAP transporter large permease subunit n=1 Tax=Psychrobacillus lasiicapitis TaxID=1636719 RepID=A0A544T2Y1_9BACI|nr:TRAP transporter large permease subunit [Psychrobacillus lasiicapitis]TQR11819.1 TRAP transporter large permease subunit [Psychrobacillus lasiicapitis]GGA19706.1 C4-dicarboxylate TRAP transporter large permease protein DctM [Psychrobacillus lasiicapitis]